MSNLSRIHPGLQLRVNKRARRIALRLDSKKRTMYLVVPAWTKIDKAYRFAYEHREWIKENLGSLPEPVPFEHGAVVPFCGQKIRIKICYDSDLRSTRIELKKNTLYVWTNKDDPSGRIARFLKEEARKVLTEIAERKAACAGKKIKCVTVRDTKSRWGSCNYDGEISFSWRLVFAPREAMDYVVAHEVAHLVHYDHSDRFWNLCKRLSASYTKGRQWMHDHGHTLMRYGWTGPQE